MASKTSHWALLSPNQRIAEAEGRDMSEWKSSVIVRTPQGMKDGKYPPDRVQIFIGDLCTYDSDTPRV